MIGGIVWIVWAFGGGRRRPTGNIVAGATRKAAAS